MMVESGIMRKHMQFGIHECLMSRSQANRSENWICNGSEMGKCYSGTTDFK